MYRLIYRWHDSTVESEHPSGSGAEVKESEEKAMTTWDYAQLSHLAKELGGPQALISNIRAGGISVGRIQGGVIGSVATLVAGGIGLYAYDKHQRKIALAEQSATMLKANIEVYEEAHSSTEVDEATRETQHSEEETVTESSGGEEA